MSMLCSLLGHSYGDSVVEHGREQQGDRMVLSVLEYEECQRCGERRTISENTRQVRADPPEEHEQRVEPAVDQQGSDEGPEEFKDSAEDQAEAGRKDSGAEVLEADADTPKEPLTDEESVTEESATASDQGEILENDTPEEPLTDEESVTEEQSIESGKGEILESKESVTNEPGGGKSHGADVTSDEPVTDKPDEGEILEEEEPRAWPDPDEGTEAEPVSVEDDAEILEDGPEEWPETETGEEGTGASHRPWPTAEEPVEEGETPAPWPEQGDDDGADEEQQEWPTVDDDAVILEDSDGDGDIESVDPVPQEMEERRSIDGATFYCPRCSFRDPVERSSLRAGDICPECREGYVAVRD